jgi:hypothetical protein
MGNIDGLSGVGREMSVYTASGSVIDVIGGVDV